MAAWRPGPPGAFRRYFHVPSPRPPPDLGCVASPSSRHSILREYGPSLGETALKLHSFPIRIK